jgi:hypothetical protein
MPKTDNGFQGFRPHAYGDVWDAMSSPERRRAFWSDMVVAAIGATIIYWMAS